MGSKLLPMTLAELCIEYVKLSEAKGKPLSYSRVQQYKRLAAHPSPASPFGIRSARKRLGP